MIFCQYLVKGSFYCKNISVQKYSTLNSTQVTLLHFFFQMRQGVQKFLFKFTLILYSLLSHKLMKKNTPRKSFTPFQKNSNRIFSSTPSPHPNCSNRLWKLKKNHSVLYWKKSSYCWQYITRESTDINELLRLPTFSFILKILNFRTIKHFPNSVVLKNFNFIPTFLYIHTLIKNGWRKREKLVFIC